MGVAPIAARFVAGPTEPGIAATVAAAAVAEVVAAAAAAVDWENYRKCSQVCQAESGDPCVALNGRVAGGRPDGVRVPLPRAHGSRKRRTGR